MKKIAIVMTSMRTGGIQSALYNLIGEISKLKIFKIDLILFNADIELNALNVLRKKANILSAGVLFEIIPITQKECFKKNVFLGVIRLFLGGICKIFGHGIVYKLLSFFTRKIGNYDVAIAFAQSAEYHSLYGGCNEYVLKNIVARKKISFIHCDYLMANIVSEYNHNIYKKFDAIAAVSQGVKETFLKCEPDLQEKVFIVHNCINIDNIKELSLSKINDFCGVKGGINFLTVSRPSLEKGHVRILPALQKAKQRGIKFCWHIVGGKKEDFDNGFTKKIKEMDLVDNIVFYGNKINPYPYFKKCSFLIVPSLHEAAPMVFFEAAVLKLPVFATKTLSTTEMIEQTGIGIVCNNNDKDLNETLLNILSGEIEFNCNVEVKISNNKAIDEFLKVMN